MSTLLWYPFKFFSFHKTYPIARFYQFESPTCGDSSSLIYCISSRHELGLPSMSKYFSSCPAYYNLPILTISLLVYSVFTRQGLKEDKQGSSPYLHLRHLRRTYNIKIIVGDHFFETTMIFIREMRFSDYRI